MSKALESLLQPPASLEELDIPSGITIDIILRLIFAEGDTTASRLEEVLHLPYKVLDEILVSLQNEHLLEVPGSTGGIGRRSYVFRITDEGKAHARDAMERSQYIGPAPVPVDKYNEGISLQAHHKQVKPKQVQTALDHLILPENFDRRLGPAINAGSSLFLYGPPGNGKTTIAEAIGGLVAGTDPIWLPYAVTVGNQIIQIYDQLVHKNFPADTEPQTPIDPRWAQFKRPVVMVGGELTLDSLDLRLDPVSKFYEAPLQMKANGGMFLIDDFGRQQVSPTDLLNRWIVPLETEVDFFRLQTGQTFQIPFKQLIVFSTNLDPAELVDDAFLRRIQMKVEVGSPDKNLYYKIFAMVCKQLGVPFNQDTFVHLLQEWYYNKGRTLQAVHPRDLIKVSMALCEYEEVPYLLTPQLLDEACQAYFVDM